MRRCRPGPPPTNSAQRSEQDADADADAAVREAPGVDVPTLERPAGLTEREAHVIGLLARGYQTKQVARALAISAKTADRHIQNAYGEIGVSTRAAAALFAMEHGLVAWGELRISRRHGRPWRPRRRPHPRSPRMVDAARRRGSERGVTNVEDRVADTADTGLDDGSVDGVVCRFTRDVPRTAPS